MRLVTFRADGGGRLGVVVDGDQVVEVDQPSSMRALIDSGEEGLARLRSGIARGRKHRLSDLELLAPLPDPRGNVIAIGLNYGKHAQETASAVGDGSRPPPVFTKAITSLTGPFANIAIDQAISDKLDWEVELGVVIGRAGANIRRTGARDFVFGYTVLNDVSARDIQSGWGGQWFKGKSLDRSSPTGPWIVTADEIPDAQDLDLRLRINGVLKQDGNTRDMIHPVFSLIEWVSKGMTLLPGSIIATGTPDGVGFTRTPPEFLQPGDVMETEIEGIGTMRNRIVAAGRD